MASDQFAAFIAMCGFAGLRRGEASALRVSDVDFLRKEINVSRQVQWTDDGQMEIRPLKYGSERTVFPDRLVALLAEHVRLYRPGTTPTGGCFPAAVTQHCPPMRPRWPGPGASCATKSASRTGCTTFGTSTSADVSGPVATTVQRALGHSSAAITLTTYSQLWPDANDRTRKAAGELLDQSLGTAADPLRTEG